AYLTAVLDRPDELEVARYFVGRRTIFGLFPAAGRKVYLFYMISAGSMPAVKAAGLDALRTNWLKIDPSLEKTIQSLVDWDQTAYMPTSRHRTGRWVSEGAVLSGGAEHAMNV